MIIESSTVRFSDLVVLDYVYARKSSNNSKSNYKLWIMIKPL